MTDILNKQEMDSILSAVVPDEKDAGAAAAGDSKKMKPYDFRKPDRFTLEQVKSAMKIHENFAMLATEALTTLLRKGAGMHADSVDQLTFGEFLGSLPNPATMAVLSVSPLPGVMVMEMDQAFTFAAVERMAGGTTQPSGMNRDHTEIERSLVQILVAKLAGIIGKAWAGYAEFKPVPVSLEQNPGFMQALPPHDMVLVAALNVLVGKIEGTVNLCYPYTALEPVIEKLGPQYRGTHSGAARARRLSGSAAGITLYRKFRPEGYVFFSDAERWRRGTRIPIDPDQCGKLEYRITPQPEPSEQQNG